MNRGISVQLDSLAATDHLAQRFARAVEPGDVILLSGELGAGKTTLVRAFAKALGVDQAIVSSPTFTVMNEYPGGRVEPVVHMDAYRLEGEDEGELLELGWDERVRQSGVTLIEWGERIEQLLPRVGVTDPVRVVLAHAGETERTAQIMLPESWRGREASRDLTHYRSTPPDSERASPFATEREQLADLYHWLSGSYRVSRPVEADDELDD